MAGLADDAPRRNQDERNKKQNEKPVPNAERAHNTSLFDVVKETLAGITARYSGRYYTVNTWS